MKAFSSIFTKELEDNYKKWLIDAGYCDTMTAVVKRMKMP